MPDTVDSTEKCAVNHEFDPANTGYDARAFRPLRGTLRPRNADGASARARARLRSRQERFRVSKTICRFADEFRGASHAAAIRRAPHRKTCRAAHLFEARRFAAYRRAQN